MTAREWLLVLFSAYGALTIGAGVWTAWKIRQFKASSGWDQDDAFRGGR